MSKAKQDNPLEESLRGLSAQDVLIVGLAQEVTERQLTRDRSAALAEDAEGIEEGERLEREFKHSKWQLNATKAQLRKAQARLTELQTAHDGLQRSIWQAELATLDEELASNIDARIEETRRWMALEQQTTDLLMQINTRKQALGLPPHTANRVGLAIESKVGRLPIAQLANIAYELAGFPDRQTTLAHLAEFLPSDEQAIEQAAAGVDFVGLAMQRHAEAQAKQKAEQDERIQAVWQTTIADMPETAPTGERSVMAKFRIWWRSLGSQGQTEMQRHVYFKHPTLETRRAFIKSSIQGSASTATTTRGDASWLANHAQEALTPALTPQDFLRSAIQN